MHLTSNNLVLLGMLLGLCSAAPAPAPVEIDDPGFSLLPPTCIGFVDGAIKTPTCFTATTITTVTPSTCVKPKCTNGPIACPMYIKLTTTSVPCSTDCCPKTPTATITKKIPCPTCTTTCVIPTQTITVTTGCKTTPPVTGPILTGAPTATFVIG
ncbi:hypothetical protein C8A05DRAFT_39353 [Staphylotrichum tortipilum]|uniref:Uncharacterized protein n=1 Tax=Staphylotrichum tortipilum TaxID=2831512 RepID=A0AAN6RP73_9PEZI|nr:hypothetical protein C8A05DRAFT_39353 [Staphylotrichum longicolle]